MILVLSGFKFGIEPPPCGTLFCVDWDLGLNLELDTDDAAGQRRPLIYLVQGHRGTTSRRRQMSVAAECIPVKELLSFLLLSLV